MGVMRKGCGIGILLAVLLLLTAVFSWWAFPRVVASLPAQARLYLPETMLQAASTPLPTALPAPDITRYPLALMPTIALPTAVSSPTAAIPPAFTAASAYPGNRVTSPDTSAATPSPTPVPLPQQVHIGGLTVIPQQFNNCGPANLTLNLAHYGYIVDQLEVAAQIRPQYEDRNVSPEELVHYVNEQTPLRAAVYSGGDIAVLKRLLANGFPVVIEKGYVPNDWQGWMGHYLTLIGYDDTTQEFTVLDTFLGPWDSSGLTESYDFIEAHWQHFNYAFFLVYPPEQETAVAALIGPELADPLTMWRHAAQTAQAETAVAAQNPYSRFNLGTSLTHLGQLTGDQAYFQNAATAYDQARTIGLPWRMLWYQFQPYEAYLAVGRSDDALTLANATLSSSGGLEEAYYYRGLAYLAQGNPDQARLDFQQAITWNPTFTPAQEAYDALPSR